jgi:hypothetical protein
MQQTLKGSVDYKQGIRGIAQTVSNCWVCGRETNLYFKTSDLCKKLHLACSMSCAQKLCDLTKF